MFNDQQKPSKSIQAAKRASLLAMADLQKNLIASALEERDGSGNRLDKRYD